MNVKYYYEFKGFDNILNRVEILTKDTVKVEEIKATDVPFVLQYGDVKKLTPLQGSGATLSLISTTIFQFENLHTDNMQAFRRQKGDSSCRGSTSDIQLAEWYCQFIKTSFQLRDHRLYICVSCLCITGKLQAFQNIEICCRKFDCIGWIQR